MDRNAVTSEVSERVPLSLSARRAWIEINVIYLPSFHGPVALRKESVDRNQGVHYDNYNLHWSLSARRAWIEIVIAAMTSQISVRSLSARRAWIEIAI